MLRKHTEIDVDPKAPFNEDKLSRQDSVKTLTRLVQSTTQPIVLSVEAPWGWGKTTFIRMWRAYLESQGHLCLQFNAWENDFADDPLLAFLAEMRGAIEGQPVLGKSDPSLQRHWNKVKEIGAGVLRKGLPVALQVATQGLLHHDGLKETMEALGKADETLGEFAATLAKERLQRYEQERNGIKVFREHLTGFAEQIVSTPERKSPLVFFVDELDRCRPDFSIRLMERIKHLFNVPEIVFVLAIDRHQLSQSVKSLYGQGMDADGYLRRFIDFAFTLPQPDSKSFCHFLFDRFCLAEIPNVKRGGAEGLTETFAALANAWKLSLRTQEQSFTQLNLILRTMHPEVEVVGQVLGILVAFKAYKPNLMERLKTGAAPLEEAMELVKEVRFQNWVEVTLTVGMIPQEAKDRRLESWRSADNQNEKLKMCQSLEQGTVGNIVSYYLARLELTARFT